jgi:hypothetical protein
MTAERSFIMKRSSLLLILVAGIVICGALPAAEPKPLAEVDTDAMTNETQVTGGGDDEMNMVWWIPQEFWQATLAADPDVSAEEAELVVSALSGYCIIGIVRAHIDDDVNFDFVSEADVLSKLVVWHFDADGERTILRMVESVRPDAVELLGALRPILSAAMGELGSNFHLFIFEDLDEEGNRIVSPYEGGELWFALMEIGNLSTIKVKIDLPLNSLHVPPVCTDCDEAMNISWNFCPFCGVKLAE